MIKLNLGRNCLKIIIRTYGIKEIFIPYYSCKTIWQSVREENCKIRFYHIDENFMPADEFRQNDFILYINYFGLFENNVKKLCQKYKNIILDNTQSFYSQHQGIASFNSLRKFFPVQNGAYLFGIDKITEKFQDDELKLEYADINSNYEQFKKNELILNNEKIKNISKFSEAIMHNIDFENDKKQRIFIYKKYAEIFDEYNILKLPVLDNQIPFCYPFCTNNNEICNFFDENNITILRLWNDMPSNFKEYKTLHNVGALPLDNINLANKIIELGKSSRG